MRIGVNELIMVLGLIFVVFGGGITLLVLTIRALIKYLRGDKKDKAANVTPAPTGTASTAQNQDGAAVLQSLGEALKNARTARKFTQEYVADTLGVSRQAVSKWENGTSDPSTSNLIALAKLYEVSVEALLANVEA